MALLQARKERTFGALETELATKDPKVQILAMKLNDQIGVDVKWNLIRSWKACDLRGQLSRIHFKPTWHIVTGHAFHVLANKFVRA